MHLKISDTYDLCLLTKAMHCCGYMSKVKGISSKVLGMGFLRLG